MRADASRRSAATARRWTSSRASGSAMASSSQVRSRADRKTHMLSILLLPTWSPPPKPPGADLRDFLPHRAVHQCRHRSQGWPHSRAWPISFAALPAARRTNHCGGEAGRCPPRGTRGMSMTAYGSWVPGSIVIRTSASAAVPPHPRPPPGHHARKVSAHVPGRDHVTGPDQIRAPGESCPAHPDETCTHSYRFPARDDTHLSNESPGACGAGEAGVRVPGHHPPACSQICAAAETKHPGRDRRHSVSSGQQLVRAPRHGSAAGVWRGAGRVAAACPASREEQHVI